jgi:hypothetical protein
VTFFAITLYVASQRVFIILVVVVYFVIGSVRKLLDTPSYLLNIFADTVANARDIYRILVKRFLPKQSLTGPKIN